MEEPSPLNNKSELVYIVFLAGDALNLTCGRLNNTSPREYHYDDKNQYGVTLWANMFKVIILIFNFGESLY